ncbi:MULTISPECIES: DNA topoisomerase (ATP-hydrolyzing) subunit B [Psychrilyobacter]|uniref:DNA gyrase subunit B n=1 Tax=Psychrilyobacter piezotolerans TaxID=2293438 RepID=A0ABX9KHM6_9FUSO|nr:MULTISPECIES: DNA topoisomerase (ATP-hydrolyzing) subunit B [Psychrilyobacter]MCS5421162.1 DNA topoisomerase (ATP-hydrolyzing) subunit B [Psychrilyobacter sp. S5]NDI77923.1 DNA topoisomerase (ATP-hydrolyzing) subunit B [Psychrilyobacter piezotolerans]RDE62039.1 DNA topoisomerase (ATP-hydrolyzing) subunit B [Psychrilyobacter sp. S5]REI41286.1 DNA topoisomerase (ATP-hydrolyzing) subunit B [Psychrilyobacter piezotolerans]
MSNNYKAEDITVLEGLEAVRKRPGMYIGSTSERGLHHLVWEVVDNSVDEALAGHCDKITINVLEDNVIEVIDNGRGIPTGMHPKHGKSALEIVLTVLHAGGKFENDNYKVSGGLHGVGISVVNALSEWMEVYVKREGEIFHQRLERGKPMFDVKTIGKTKETGTRIVFKADDEIFETLIYSFETLKNRLKELAYLNKGLEIVLTDSRKEEKVEETLKFDGGIIDFLAELEDGNEKLIKEPIYMNGEAEGVIVEIAMTYTIKQRESIFSFVNNINTHEGGTHVSGFRTALTRVVNDVAKTMGLVKERDGNFQGSDIREGMTAIISLKVPDPQFEGQTKTKLGSSEVTSIVSGIVGKYLKMHLEDTPADARNVIEKILMSKKAREAAKKARELVMRKSALEVGSLPGKLADCSSKKPEESEVYIVEGDSAGGSAKQGRDRHTQAILPLRGKILNVEKAGLHRALENTEVRAMITAFGAGMNDEMNLDKLRYHKIIIMTDADVDGAHIRTLILTFLFRYMHDLITNGNIYIAQPPLFKITAGRSVQYAYTDKQMKDATDLLNIENRRFTLQRYKGLGEMNPEQLWETTMDPDTRTLLQVSIDDAVEADKLFDKLMGDKVEPRKKFIEEGAEFVKNLDI